MCLLRVRRCTVAILLLLNPLLLRGQASSQDADQARREELRELRESIEKLSARLTQLEHEEEQSGGHTPTSASSQSIVTVPIQPVAASPANIASDGSSAASVRNALTEEERAFLHSLRGTTINATIDGYYAYNFNTPADLQNQLRAYDISSNSFSINQADLIVEHALDPDAGIRWGGRVDLQFGQATETLQGSSANELRPAVWRNLYQAYGSYVAPVGSGIQLDFGKWASVLGAEGNYTKDQINYSRSYFYNYLPFYHTGLRATYTFNPSVTVAYWLVNGAQATEAFNGYKSQAFITTLKPAKSVTWNVNYFFGQLQPSPAVELASGVSLSIATDPTATAATASTATPNGREHIFDSYATWTPTGRLTLLGEADLVINRVLQNSAPQHTAGGAAYIQYRVGPHWAVAGRTEYLEDASGLFSGQKQALKEVTLTSDWRLGDGFLVRSEWRSDFSNRPFFLTAETGVLSHVQPTATLGLIWWWGQKQGSW
jgi:Putative beta-barrel porin-2, OmpL-like. bbp2